jgi:hypothetical protein
MRRALLVLLALTFAAVPFVVAGCPNYTNIPEVARAEIDAVHEGQLLWLKQSLYVGQFYDDDRYELLYPRPFDQLSYLRTIEGDPIPPPPARGIVPAGTRVRVESIRWPTGQEVFARPIYTPRYTTWVFLRVGAERGKTNLERPKRHVLIMPGGIPDKDTFTHWFGAFLVEDDPNPWLDELPGSVRDGVLTKRPVLGMDYDMLTAAMGFPDKLTRAPDDGGSTMEVAIYGASSVVLKDGVVVRISDPARDIDEAMPGSDAASAPTKQPIGPETQGVVEVLAPAAEAADLPDAEADAGPEQP